MRAGGSASLLVHGEPGVGKSALLEQLVASAAGFRVLRAVGVEGEVDLPYAGLHQLCRPLMETVAVLPQPQRDALRVAFGLSSGEPADRFIVGLAALSLMSEVASAEPLLCVVDDAQWLDPETTRALAFVARRLGADSVGLVFAGREVVEELDRIPRLELGGLSPADAGELLDTVVIGRLDGPVRERFLAETRGNPLALIELPRALTPAEAATGLLRSGSDSLSARIEDSFRRQLERLPEDTQRLLVLAAAEPLGDPSLLLRAASRLGLAVDAADAAEEVGLFRIQERCSFRHPLVRSAVYGAAPPRERRAVHAALAEATDPELDPDRRAWHRAQATAAPDEEVAVELERTAARAKARAGLPAAGAFLEHAAMLTPDPDRRAERALAAAEVMYEAGAFDAVENLLRSTESGRLDEFESARAERLRAGVSFARSGDFVDAGAERRRDREKDAILRLVAAGERLRRLEPSRGYTTHLEALRAAFFLADPELLGAIARALGDSGSSESGAIVERIARGMAEALQHGTASAGREMRREAVIALRDKQQLEETDLPLLIDYTESVTKALWDFDSWEILTRRAVQLARDTGSLLALPRLLGHWADVKGAAGDLGAAGAAVAEAEAIAGATGAGLDWDSVSPMLDAWRFDETEALRRIDRQERGAASIHPSLDCARAFVHNAAGRYEAALAAAQRSCDVHPFGVFGWSLPELIEAAVRCNQHDRARAALEHLVDRTRAASGEWGLGVEARSTALLAEDVAVAEPLYREAIERLHRAGTRPDLARAHLVYGEWLRRVNRRIDAREQLRTAHELFADIGMPTFAERARRELAATGETARKRTDDTRTHLTAQELQIARLAADGLTNPEIGAHLFLSPRTVEWHLRSIYPKLGVTSRRELRTALRTDLRTA